MKKLPKNSTKGQTVLIILLVMAIMLTIGLSTISSSITDIKISQETEEASRAFYVAESALEESLLLPFGPAPAGSIGGINYQVSKQEQGGEEFLLPSLLEAGKPQIIWLVGHEESGSLKTDENYTGPVDFYWGNKESSEKPALVVSFSFKDGGNYKVSRYNFDPDETRRNTNHFDPANVGSYTVGGQDLKFSASIDIPEDIQPYFLKLALIYNSSPQYLGVKVSEANPKLPSQGFCFESNATVESSGITRKIKQCKLWQGLPDIFLWGLFSGQNLIK